MTQEQVKILEVIYKKPLTLQEINAKFRLKLIFDNFDYVHIFDTEFHEHIDFRENKLEFAQGLCSINKRGKEFVEQRVIIKRSKTFEWVRYCITTLIALAAFLKSFFFT